VDIVDTVYDTVFTVDSDTVDMVSTVDTVDTIGTVDTVDKVRIRDTWNSV